VKILLADSEPSTHGPLRHLARHNEMSAVEVTAEVVQTSRDVAV
jgi:hypothetical protein